MTHAHDLVVILGMPTDETLRQELAEARAAKGHGFVKPVIYTGAVRMPCRECRMELYVGPRQQDALATLPQDGTLLLCPWCAVKRAVETSTSPTTIYHLGNPEGHDRD